MELRHSAAAEERDHLARTLEVIAGESEVARREKAEAEGELATARMYDPDALPIRELLYSRALNTLRSMELAAKKPYFTRVDFTESGGEKRVYYIGKYGVTHSGTLDVEVVDWRAPVANLYYSGQIGPMRYEAPDGVVEGELTLKRQLGIENGVLETIFDTDVVSQDAYLQSVLGAMTGDRLREIVTTIQAEQNFVIRHPLSRNLVVQGAAGSGKTTIALHRIAYLLYAFRDRLDARDMLILAPSPLFLNFISGVLPDLGVELVRQSTFPLFMADWLGEALPKVDLRDRLEEILALPAADLDRRARGARAKGSLRLAEKIDQWLDGFEKRFSPEEGISFGPARLFTNEEMERFLLVDEKPFPMARRVQEFQKQLLHAASSASKRINAWLQAECDRRAEAIRASGDTGETLRARLDKLYRSRDARMKETAAQVRPFVKKTIADLPDLSPARLYRAFWEDMRACPEADIALAAEHTLRRFAQRLPLEPEDVAPIALFALRLIETKKPDVRHIVVDEAQDLSPLEFYALRRIMPTATMTIVGDLQQGVSSWRGLNAWEEITEGVFGGNVTRHELVTSYRSTVEIMELAARVAKNRPVPGLSGARPVLRHGEEPTIVSCGTDAERCTRIAETIAAWREAGFSSIAVISRSQAELRALEKRLPASLGARLLDPDSPTYEGGVLLAHASAVKGLEFDGVIVSDASAAAYPARDLDARLLYVCLTRALHRLAVFHIGAASPLLQA